MFQATAEYKSSYQTFKAAISNNSRHFSVLKLGQSVGIFFKRGNTRFCKYKSCANARFDFTDFVEVNKHLHGGISAKNKNDLVQMLYSNPLLLILFAIWEKGAKM